MSEDNRVAETALRLKELIDNGDLSGNDRYMAERCLRRLEQPLRLTVFGTDPKHAIQLINLMVGQPVVSPNISRARIQFLHGQSAYARLQYRDGSQERIDGKDFRRLFDDSPSRVRIYLDLPVLKKISLLVAAEKSTKSLCADVEKTLPPADIAIFAGDELTHELNNVWQSLPDRLQHHSYLVLSPDMDYDSWKPIAQEFVEILRVDPRRAQAAKSAEGGVDKEEFKESGGAQLVKTIKREIDLLLQSSLDASEVLLLRYSDDADEAVEPSDDHEDGLPPGISEEVMQQLRSPQLREQVYSVPLGKLASRSRMLGAAASPPTVTSRTLSMAIKNMPKSVVRPMSKVATKARTNSRKSRPGATPWSLGL